METVEHANLGQEVTAATLTLGQTLRQAREQRGLSIADVVNLTKLAPRQIEALEADDYQSLPETAFVRGFVRSYGKVLQLDSAILLTLLPSANKQPEVGESGSIEADFPDVQHAPRRQNLIWLLGTLLLAVLVALVSVWQFTPSDEATTPQLEQSAIELPADVEVIPSGLPTVSDDSASQLSAAMPPEAMAAQTSTLESAPAPETIKAVAKNNSTQVSSLRIVFEKDSWVEVHDKNQMLSSQTNLAGSELHLDGNPPFSLVIGRAESVKLYYRGKPVDLNDSIRSSSGVARLTLD